MAIKSHVFKHLLRFTLGLDRSTAAARALQRALTLPDSYRALITNTRNEADTAPGCLNEWDNLLPDRCNLKFFLKTWSFGHDTIREAFTPAMHAYFDAIVLFVIVLQIEEGYFTLTPQALNLARFSHIVQALPEELQVRVCIAAHPDMDSYRAEVTSRGYHFRPEYVTRAIKEVFEITETSAGYREVTKPSELDWNLGITTLAANASLEWHF